MNHTRGSDPTITADGLLEYIVRAHRGKSEGVSAEGLATGMGVKASAANLRKMRAVVEELRDLGVPICARPETGYFYATTREEIEETIGALIKRGRTALRQAEALKLRLETVGEQKVLNPPGKSKKESEKEKMRFLEAINNVEKEKAKGAMPSLGTAMMGKNVGWSDKGGSRFGRMMEKSAKMAAKGETEERWQDTPEGRMKIARWQVGQEKITGVECTDDNLAPERAAIKAEEAGYGNSEDTIRGESALDEYTRIEKEGV